MTAGAGPAPAKDCSRGVTIVEWMTLLVGGILTVQYAWLLDDAFVYFRYVDNAVFAGRGLVYNAGEFVEGFSSPLWLLILLVLRSTGVGWWLAIRGLGVLSCVAYWALLVRLGRLTAPTGAERYSLPLVLLLPNYAVLCYFTSGVETPLVQVMAATYALAVFRPESRWLQLAAGLGPLVRYELAVPWLVLAVWSARRTRKLPWTLLTTTVTAMAGWLVFCVWYYAEALPNTFYLKNVRLIRQGVTYLLDTANPYGFQWILGGAALALAVIAWRDRIAARAGRSRPALHLSERGVLLLLAAVVVAFVVKIGGDSRHFRYLAFPVTVAVASTAGLPEQILARIRWSAPAAVPMIVALPLMALVSTRYPDQVPRHPILATLGGEVAIPDQSSHGHKHHPVLINDAAAHRHHEDLACPPWGRCEKVDRAASYRAALAAPGRPSHRGVIVEYWCAGIYAHAEDRAVHSLGLTDAFLARTKMPHDRPGHKWGLVPLARDLGRIERAAGNRPHVGMFRQAVNEGEAPPWVQTNLASLEVLERKVFNRHRLFENLRLALTFPEPIDPDRQLASP